MILTFLGTSAGTPTRERNVTALAVEVEQNRGWYLIDCGEGTQHQLLRTRHSLQKLRAIFITHVHGDHTYGLPGLLATASMAGRTEPLPVIAPEPLRPFIETAIRAADSNLNYQLEFVRLETENFNWQDDAVNVTTTPLSHRVPCYAYTFTELNLEKKLLTGKLQANGIPAGPMWGEIQRGANPVLANGEQINSADYVAVSREPRKIIVAGDNDQPELLTDTCRGAHLLVHEATYTQAVSDRVGPAPQHSSAAQVGKFAESVQLPNLILTHFSSRYQFTHKSAPLIDEIASEAKQHYRGHLELARDFAEFQLTKDLTLITPGSENG